MAHGAAKKKTTPARKIPTPWKKPIWPPEKKLLGEMSRGSPKTAGLFPDPPHTGKVRQKNASHQKAKPTRMPMNAMGTFSPT